MFIYKCDYCGEVFKVKHQRKYNKKYCSYKCSIHGRIGIKLSEKHKEKIKQANLGKIISLETRKRMSKAQSGKTIPPDVRKKISERLKIVQKGHILSTQTKKKISNSLKGHHLSQETKNKISQRTKGINNPNFGNHKLAGKNHWNYKNGASCEQYPHGWTNFFKEQIRKRDSHQCQICGKLESEMNYRLSVHHIDYDKNNLDPYNLISLCQNCHIKTNYNREYWQEFFKQKLGVL